MDTKSINKIPPHQAAAIFKETAPDDEGDIFMEDRELVDVVPHPAATAHAVCRAEMAVANRATRLRDGNPGGI